MSSSVALLALMAILSASAMASANEFKAVFDNLSKEIIGSDIVETEIIFDEKDGELLMNGEIRQLMDLDNDWKVHVEIWRADERDGEYKQPMQLREQGLCDTMAEQYKKYFYASLKEHSNAADPDVCPVTAETYVIVDYPVNSSPLRKLFRPGYYRVVIALWKDEVERLKYVFEGHIVEANN